MIKKTLLLFMILFSLGSFGQDLEMEECEIAFISHHFVRNNTGDTIKLEVDHKNQDSFPTSGPKYFAIPPNSELRVSKLEWAGEFKNPTSWFIFDMKSAVKLDINAQINWKFSQTNDTEGIFLFKIP